MSDMPSLWIAASSLGSIGRAQQGWGQVHRFWRHRHGRQRNVAVTQPTTGPGFLTLYPGGTPRPLAATINYNAGKTRANNAIIPLGVAGDITVRCGQGSGTAQLIVDVNGYFE